MGRDRTTSTSESGRSPGRAAGRFRFVRGLARLMLRSQYRRIEVEGAGSMPAEGAVLIVANHFSSLTDSMALLVVSPRPASFLAKAPLWKSRLLRPFLDGVGAIPVYRPEDREENEGLGARANVETFRRCRERLAAGGSLALFPEGVSQPRPRLMPVRTGAARIALDTRAPVTIVPAGLVYDPEGRSRGDLLVRFGEPFEVRGTEGFASRREAITATTRRIEASLRDLLAEADSQADVEALRTLRVVWDQERGIPTPRTLSEAHDRHRRMARGLAELREVAPLALEELRADTDAYVRALHLVGIPPEVLRLRYDAARVLRFAFVRLPPFLLGVPLGSLAAWVTWPLRKAGDVVALRSFGGAEDVRALCRMLGIGLLLVLGMLAGGIAALLLGGPLVALAVVVGLPALLAFHVLWQDHRENVTTRVRCFLLLAGGNLRQNLEEQRHALYERLEACALLMQEAGRAPRSSKG